MNGTHIMTNPYESQGLSQALESCCICMEDFESHSSTATSSCVADEERGESDPNDPLMVVLPCKSHFFHLECISQWIMKQNACPVCRDEITLARLKEQKKEIAELFSKAKKDAK